MGDGRRICCAHCVFNPLGCRCKYGEWNVAETYQDPEFPEFGDDDDYDDENDGFEAWDYGPFPEAHYCKVCGGDGMEDDVCPCEECDGTGMNPAYW